MRADSDRWVEVTPCNYAHERAALAYIRDRLPDTDPYRAWTNLELITDQGRPLEIDILVLGPAGFSLVELKYWAGPISGDRYRLVRGAQGDTFDNPIRSANSKARILRGQLLAAYERFTKEAGRNVRLVPWVEPAIFLHHHDFRVAMAANDRQGLFGPDEVTAATGLPGIIAFLTREPSGDVRRVDGKQSQLLRNLLKKEGMGRITRREVGAYVLEPRPFDSGLSWQDYLATHTRFRDDRRRVRIYSVGRATSADQEASLVRAAEREYRLLSHIQHPGLLAPVEYLDSRMGPALIYPFDPAAQRLDLLLASPGKRFSLTEQLTLIRSVAETLSSAHGRHITHRGLSPRAIYVRLPGQPNGELTAQVTDWQTGAHLPSTSSDSPTIPSVFRGTRNPSALYDAQAEIYQAPEAATSRAPDEVRLDVFSLGAVSYLILSGQPPAPDIASLYGRLQADGGLDLAGQVDGVGDALRHLILDATRAEPAGRLRDMDAFLERLAEVERLSAEPVEEPDPLDPRPDAVLRERWRVLRRLGGGSSAVAILVEDLESGERDRHVVLKVARDGEKAVRLREEAEILRRLNNPHIAGLRVPEPILLERARTALVLEHAGDQTLARALRDGRLSVDRLERWGQDLFEAVAYLESARVSHRDIKPANLGIRLRPADRTLHLVLFDFSLSRAPATDLEAGTATYLDPFLGVGSRQRWDDHAERYAVAVTLFEMASGRTPTYGPDDPNPKVVDHEAMIEAAMFEPAVAAHLVPFFRRALRRDAGDRYQTTEEMARAWQDVFMAAARAVPDPDELAARATLSTPLAESGLSVRAQSALEALEPLSVVTVEGLLQIPVARLRNLAGVNDSTRRELSARARQWRALLQPPEAAGGSATTKARSIEGVIEALIPGARRVDTIARAARLLLGRPQQASGDVPEPWLTPRDLAAQLGLTPARGSQLIGELRRKWGASQVLAAVREDLVEIVESLDGVATSMEVAEALLVRRGSTASDPLRRSQALGLTRAAVEAELEQGGQARIDMRRAGSTVLIAREPDEQAGGVAAARRLDHVVAVGRAVGTITAEAETPVPAALAIQQVQSLAPLPPGMVPVDARRLLRLAAAASDQVAVSPRDELYRRAMSAADALRYSGALFAMIGARFTPEELRDRVRARFPEAEPLPDRPQLDALVSDIDAQFTWDHREYRTPTAPDDTYSSKLATVIGAGPRPAAAAVDLARRLHDSIDQSGFLALGVARSDLDTARDRLAERYGLAVVDVTALLMDRMREVAAEHGIPWQAVLDADAAEPHSQEGEGLRNLVQRSVPAVRDRIAGADRPVLVTEPALLARYGHLDLIARLADQTEHRPHAVWLLIATSSADAGPIVDRRPVPIVAASQWLRLPEIAYQPLMSTEEMPS